MKETCTITSRRDKLLELILSLRDKDECRKLGLCWAEGAIAADYALKLKKGAVKSVVLSMEATDKAREAAEKLAKTGVPLYLLAPSCFDKITVLKNPEGLGIVAEPGQTLSADEFPKKGPAACLWQLMDPGNLGTIIRSAASFGCEHFILVSPCVTHFHPLAIRASAGAALASKFLYLSEEEALEKLKSEGKRVCALSMEGNCLNLNLCYNNPEDMIVVSGNEPHGLPIEVRKTLPLYSVPATGRVESLNVTAASAIAYYFFWSRKLLNQS